MKPIINILFIVLISLAIFGCKDMDDLYKHHLEGGPILYIGKVDSVVAFPGKNRLMLRWIKMKDPRAITAEVSWANGTQKKIVDLTNNNEHYMTTIIDNLEAGTYSFNIVTHDDTGNSSISVSAIGNVFSNVFESFLRIRPHVSFSNITMLLVFKKVTTDLTFVESEISYTKKGESASTIVSLKGDKTDIILVGCDVTKPISYRGVHLPEPTSIDKFYSPTVAINP